MAAGSSGQAGKCAWKPMDAVGGWADFHRWMPWAAGRQAGRGVSYFDAASAQRCLGRGEWLFFAGDSTVRELYYMLMAVAGRPMYAPRFYYEKRLRHLNGKVPYPSDAARYWPPHAFMPIIQPTCMAPGRDIRGDCKATRGWPAFATRR